MNLTSKRVLQFMTVCAGACALSASAVEWVADSFEDSDGGANGMAIKEYKKFQVPEDPTWYYVWNSDVGDASVIANETGGTYSGTRPMSAGTTANVLNLATEGQTLSRVLDSAKDFVAAPVYVDTLIKFTPSEDAPTITDVHVKAAVFVNVASNLMIYHGTPTVPAITDTGLKIDPTLWYRLTILLSQSESTPLFKVFLNGTVVTSAEAILENVWFLSAAGEEQTISTVAFQGTGMVDELVITDTTPAGIGSLSLLDQWKTANSVTEEQWTNPVNQPLWLYDYLLNINPGANADIEIDSITVSGDVATIVVVASVTTVDFTEINGQVAVKTSPDLITWSEVTLLPATTTYSVPSAEVVVTLPTGHKFIKAVVVPK